MEDKKNVKLSDEQLSRVTGGSGDSANVQSRADGSKGIGSGGGGGGGGAGGGSGAAIGGSDG